MHEIISTSRRINKIIAEMWLKWCHSKNMKHNIWISSDVIFNLFKDQILGKCRKFKPREAAQVEVSTFLGNERDVLWPDVCSLIASCAIPKDLRWIPRDSRGSSRNIQSPASIRKDEQHKWQSAEKDTLSRAYSSKLLL